MVTWSEEEYARHLAGRKAAAPKQSKYRNKPQVVDGVRFDSKRELARWRELQLMERAGKISDLRRQITYRLDVNGVHICRYIADFVYTRDGEETVEDSKGKRTREFIHKKRLMLACHGIVVEES